MSFSIPTPVHTMLVDWDLDPRNRGDFSGTNEARFATRNTKAQGTLPLSLGFATAFVNNQATSATGPLRGVYWEFLASGGYDVSTDTKLLIFTLQFNAPNRIQITDKANNGIVVRVGSGSGSPPTAYKTYQVGGNDTRIGTSRESPRAIVIDLNSTSNENIIGTFKDDDVQTFGLGTVRFNIAGNSTTQLFLQSVYVFDTTKNATNIPRFTGLNSKWIDIITERGSGYTNLKTFEWISREGNVYSLSCPIEIGDNSTATTFDDEGVSVFWSNDNDPSDPTTRITNQAFRFYMNLQSTDSVVLSGTYDAGNSYPLWDFDANPLSSIQLNGTSFKRTGTFTVSGAVSGGATFDDCGIITCTDNSVDFENATFKNPHDNYLLKVKL